MILESLYCGNICPADQAIPLDKEYQKLRQKILKGLEELESKLTPEQKMNFVITMVLSAVAQHCSTSSIKRKFWLTAKMIINGMCW